MLAACATTGATRLVWLKAVPAIAAEPLLSPHRSTPNTQQVREQTTAHALSVRSISGACLLTSPERLGCHMAAPAPPLLCLLHSKHSTSSVSTPRTPPAAVRALIHALFLCMRCFLDACGCSEVFGRRRSVEAPVPLFPRKVLLPRVIPTLKQSAH